MNRGVANLEVVHTSAHGYLDAWESALQRTLHTSHREDSYSWNE